MYTKKIITNFKKVKRSAATRKRYKRGTRSQQERGVRKRSERKVVLINSLARNMQMCEHVMAKRR